jgi:Spy/CpxP family protein refolding chaperone
MARQFAWILAAALACPPAVALAEEACGHGQGESGQQKPKTDSARASEPNRRGGVKWWLEPKYRAELGISDQQSARIEQIFQAHVPAQRARYDALRVLEPALEQLIKDGLADPAIVEREVDRVERLTAEVRTNRIVTLYRMHRELTAEQRVKFKAMEERREAEHRKSSDPVRRQ